MSSPNRTGKRVYFGHKGGLLYCPVCKREASVCICDPRPSAPTVNVRTGPLCLPPRRRAVLIALYSLARPTPWGLGYAPTIRGLSRALGYRSTCGVSHQLAMLAQAGLAYQLAPNTDRAWRPNYDRVLFVTQKGVTDVSERLEAAPRYKLAGRA